MTSSELASRPRRRPLLWSFLVGGGVGRRAGIIGMTAIVVMAVAAPLLTHFDPTTIVGLPLLPPGGAHLLGTDQIGRDQLARLLYGARIDLQIGIVGVTTSMVIGVIIGLIAGYFGGIVDAIIGRTVDVFVAFPSLVLVIAIVALLGPGLVNFYIAIALVSWTAYARIIRAETIAIRNREFVLAERALGYSDARIMFAHILPNVIAPALVFGMSDFVLDILAGASLGFFGLGVPSPTPEWGVMIAEGRGLIFQTPLLVLLPGLAIIIVGFFASLIGDGLADAVRNVDR